MLFNDFKSLPGWKMKFWIGISLILGLLLSFGACQYSPPVTGSAHGAVDGLLNIAFVGIQPDPELENKIKPADLRDLDKLILDGLVKKNYHPIPPGQMKGMRAAILLDGNKINPASYFKMIGVAREGGAILIGNIYRYREKMTKGDPPASVGLTLRLIRAEDGKVLWRGRYDETQKSILENFMNISRIFKKGFKWASAKELAQNGIAQLMDSFPPAKEGSDI